MIALYSGTPGSGKSYHAARDIIARYRHGGGLICNFPVQAPADMGIRPRRPLRISYWDNSQFTPGRLIAYAERYHRIGVEGQSLVIIDEAQIIYNCRDGLTRQDKNARMDWIKFYTQHRKLGFNVILIAQNDRMIDRQVRSLIETECKHRKLNNYGFGGALLSLLTANSTWFVAIDKWYGGNNVKLNSTMIRYSPRVARVYDSYRTFDGAGALAAAAGDDPDLGLIFSNAPAAAPLGAENDEAPPPGGDGAETSEPILDD